MHMELSQESGDAVLVFACAFGLAAGLIGWLLAASVAQTPEENRKYKDALPLGFRLGWLPIRWLSSFVGLVLPQKRLDATGVKLRKAGLEFTITPAQFVAGRLLCMATAVAVLWWLLASYAAHLPGELGSDSYGYVFAAAIGAAGGWIYPAIWLKDRLARYRSEIQKTLPFYLDIITLCVEAGLNVQGALNQAIEKGPKGVLRNEFMRVLRDIRAGSPRSVSLRRLSDRLQEPGVTNFISAVIQAEAMGINLGPVLRAQADQRRTERFLRAETLAMQAPVKLLFPLIAFIFPCTFIVLIFPIAMKLMQSGL